MNTSKYSDKSSHGMKNIILINLVKHASVSLNKSGAKN